MAKKENKQKPAVSTVAITSETNEMLDKLCKQYDITKKDYIKISIDYFNRTGVDIFSDDKGLDETLQAIKQAVTEQSNKQADTLNKLVDAITRVQENTDKLLAPPVEDIKDVDAIEVVDEQDQEQQTQDTIQDTEEQEQTTYWQRNKVWLSVLITILVIAGALTAAYFLYLKDFIVI